MNKRPSSILRFIIGMLALISLLPMKSSGVSSGPLTWDAEWKDYITKTNETHAHIFFNVTNISTADVVIEDVKTSCGCTVATLPSKPWQLAPKKSGQIEVIVDVRGRTGTLTKNVSVASPTAAKMLTVSVTIPTGFGGGMTPAMGDRLRNQETAATDHQAVFKTDCVKCHLEPAFGKSGGPLYKAVCAICHDSPHRATMVPDLHKLNKETDAKYWKEWITNGKAGTLMPGFTATQGGPLDEQQIDSLVDYMLITFSKPAKTSPPKPIDKKE
jgi:cytochrome c553